MRIVIFCVCSILICACSDNTLYDHTIEFDNSIWKYETPANFEFDIADNAKRYDLFLDIDHSPEYAFENLYLRINTEFPDKSTASDTLSIEMVNNQGAWVGKCRSDICDLTVFLQENTRFKNVGNHKISIEQFTRESALNGIKSISFRLGYSGE